MEFRTCEADKESVLVEVEVSCLEPGVRTTFWLSWDRDRQTIKFGTGYAMEETTLLEWTGEEQFLDYFRNSPATISLSGEMTEKSNSVEALIDKNELLKTSKKPLVKNPSYMVCTSQEVTMMSLAERRFLPETQLSQTCQELYQTIRFIELDTDVSELPDAIRHSMETKGCLLHDLLRTQSYLRVSLQRSDGESPGRF